MASASKSFSSSSSSSSSRSRKRKYTREQLLRNLELIGDLGRPLSPNLPPSPPASRSASPVPGIKRKVDSVSDPDAVKRPRTNSTADRPYSRSNSSSSQQQQSHQSNYQPAPSISQRQQQPMQPSQSLARSEPCEDGEVREEPAAQVSQPRGSTVDVPIRRPRKGKPPPHHVHEEIHDRYHSAGRKLKYSGDARFWSTYPPTHREYRPLPDPPPPTSPYHKHGGLIARLELLDALVCFTYAIWNRDLTRRPCIETWKTLEAFLSWCKAKWQAEEGINEAEKAFLGLIWMFDSFIQSRKLYVLIHYQLQGKMENQYQEMKTKIATAETEALSGVNAGLLNGKAAPPMLPSPNSANSTPDNRDDGTPKEGSGRPAASAQQPPKGPPHQIPPKLLPDHLQSPNVLLPPHVLSAISAVTIPMDPAMVQNLKDLTLIFNRAASAMSSAQATLHLPLLRRCFPKTWARMMYTTLSPTEEYEPDIEDEEGELFWPDQGITGQGIGWLCLMGKAMIKEFGKAYGYKGLDGVVPKPTPGPAR